MLVRVRHVEDESDGPLELVIAPGETLEAKVVVERRDFKDRISFGNAESGRNLPHGVYVDNIGLNGVLIPEGDSERVFFITAEPWVEPMERIIFLEAAEADRPTSNPAVLRIVGPPHASR